MTAALANILFDMTQKPQATKEKIYKLDFLQNGS